MKKVLKAVVAKQAIKHLSKGKINFKKFAGIGIALLIVGVIGLAIVIVLIVALLRWGWGATINETNTNPTVSNIVEGSKEQVADLLPTIPSSASDFINDGQINSQKIEQTYNDLPAQTQEVWKRAVSENITKELENATGMSAQTLRDLQTLISGL